MTAPTRKNVLTGSIHRIREFELEKVCLAEEFDILQIVGEGWFGKILLVEHRGTDTEMVLKALPKPYVPLCDFYREFHYGLHLGVHKNIVTTYDVAFETAGFYVFSQEYAPLGDLTSNVSETGIGELHTKRVAKQLAAALDHLHMKDLVHRDVKLDNILVFKSDFSRIKLCDFGETRKSQTVIRRRNEWLPYSPPEVLHTAVEDTYKAVTSHDVWQFGIVMFVCLTGCLPWQKAALDDPRYVRYLGWYNSSNPLRKQPKLFKLVSSRAQKLFKKILEPRPEKRPSGLGDLLKYMDDRWMAKGINEKNGTAGTEVDELCPSMYSFHSDIDEKNKLLHVLLQHGIETTVDKVAKKARIRDWIQNSVIAEEDENEDESYSHTRYSEDEEEENIRGGLHPIEQNHQRWSSLRYADEKHFNPRTGELLDKGKATNYNTTVSYDMQQIQPLTSSAPPTKYTKDENASQGSMKDSAYGSIDFKISLPNTIPDKRNSEGSSHNQKVAANTPYPSQQLQKHLQQQNLVRNAKNTIPAAKPLQNYQKSAAYNSKYVNGNISSSKNSAFNSSDINSSQATIQNNSNSNSSTTLARSSPQSTCSLNNINNINGPPVPASRKKTILPLKVGPNSGSNRTIANNIKKPIEENSKNPENQMKVVQGQMRINPYGSLPPHTNGVNGRAMNPKMVHLHQAAAEDHLISEDYNSKNNNDKEALLLIKKMLIENKTGLPD